MASLGAIQVHIIILRGSHCRWSCCCILFMSVFMLLLVLFKHNKVAPTIAIAGNELVAWYGVIHGLFANDIIMISSF